LMELEVNAERFFCVIQNLMVQSSVMPPCVYHHLSMPSIA